MNSSPSPAFGKLPNFLGPDFSYKTIEQVK